MNILCCCFYYYDFGFIEYSNILKSMHKTAEKCKSKQNNNNNDKKNWITYGNAIVIKLHSDAAVAVAIFIMPESDRDIERWKLCAIYHNINSRKSKKYRLCVWCKRKRAFCVINNRAYQCWFKFCMRTAWVYVCICTVSPLFIVAIKKCDS